MRSLTSIAAHSTLRLTQEVPMRILIAIAFGCALLLGLNHAASSGATERGAQPSYELSSPVTEEMTADPQAESDGHYECRYSPYCQKASQCAAYCGGGAAVCSQGCCACAS